MKIHNSRLVYSTDKNIPGKKTGKVNGALSTSESDHKKVLVRLERKGRGGKKVTIVQGLPMNLKSKILFFKQLKAKLGTGGTVRQDCFEFQGDH
jgi:translation initiation factor 1